MNLAKPKKSSVEFVRLLLLANLSGEIEQSVVQVKKKLADEVNARRKRGNQGTSVISDDMEGARASLLTSGRRSDALPRDHINALTKR
jgi:hypothetical protein